MKNSTPEDTNVLKLPFELQELLNMHRIKKKICFNCDKEFYGLGMLQVFVWKKQDCNVFLR